MFPAIWLAVHFVKRYFFEKVLYPSLSYSLLGVKEVPRERRAIKETRTRTGGSSFFVYSFWGLFFICFLVVVSVIRSVMDDYLLRML